MLDTDIQRRKTARDTWKGLMAHCGLASRQAALSERRAGR